MSGQLTYLIRDYEAGDPRYLRGLYGLRIRQSYPGGFQAATFQVDERSIGAHTDLAPFSRFTVTKGPVVLFDGELRDVSREWGPGGRTLSVTAYGYGILLKDDLFGPKVYADNRIDRWQLYAHANNPISSTEHAPEKFEARQDASSGTPKIRISPKASAIFAGSISGSQDFEAYYYELPKVAGAYVADAIKQVTFTYQTAFPTGSWAFVIYEYDGSGTFVTTIQTATAGPTSYTYTPNLANCKVIGIALRATADQAVWAGHVNDGAADSPIHSLEYGGHWEANLNADPYRYWHHQGGMQSADKQSQVATAKDGSSFYPDGVTRVGGAARLRWTGRQLKVYVLRHSQYGDVEYRIFDKANTLLASGTLDYWIVGQATGTVTKTDGSTTVTGSGTFFQNELTVGMVIKIPGGLGDEYRTITAIASQTSLTVDTAFGSTAATQTLYPRHYQYKILDYTPAAGFGTYVLTLRNIGTSPHEGGDKYANVDFATTGVAGMRPIEDDEVYLEVSAVTVKTTTSTVDAALIGRDLVTKYSAAAIGLSASTVEINENGDGLPDLAPLVWDDPVTGDAVLETICQPGTSDNLPLAWAVWEDKRLVLEEWDVSGTRFAYEVDPADAEISHEATIQDDFALTVAPLYEDAAGNRQIGADVGSSRRTDLYDGRQRRVALATDARSSGDAAATATAYLANHDLPSQRTRLTLRAPLRDHGGAIVPLDEVRAGRLLRINGYDEIGQYSATDFRSGLSGVIVGCDYDVDSRTLQVDLGAGPDTYERWIARIRKLEERTPR